MRGIIAQSVVNWQRIKLTTTTKMSFKPRVPSSDIVYISMMGYKNKRGVFHCKEICLLGPDYIFHTFIHLPCKYYRITEEEDPRSAEAWNNDDLTVKSVIGLILPKLANKKVVLEKSEHWEWLKQHTRKLSYRIFGWYEISIDFDRREARHHFEQCTRHSECTFVSSRHHRCAKNIALYMEHVIQQPEACNDRMKPITWSKKWEYPGSLHHYTPPCKEKNCKLHKTRL